ncbi:MAG: hypothetical protein FJX76_06660 [Armatimonadetes bacterium]|nr:hypothetical protein [Armatimonadota bacterium]
MSALLTRGLECPRCGATNQQSAMRCVTCRAELHEDEQPTLAQEAAQKPPLQLGPLTPEQEKIVEQWRTRIPLERSENYLIFQQAFEGAQSGTISADDYRFAVRKIRTIGETGCKILEDATIQKKVRNVSDEAREVKDEMLGGFRLLRDGAVLMEKWLSFGNPDDILSGAEYIDAGYRAIDAAQERALQLH